MSHGRNRSRARAIALSRRRLSPKPPALAALLFALIVFALLPGIGETVNAAALADTGSGISRWAFGVLVAALGAIAIVLIAGRRHH